MVVACEVVLEDEGPQVVLAVADDEWVLHVQGDHVRDAWEEGGQRVGSLLHPS